MAGDTQIGKKRAKAHPTKAFFVRMLTRDISLEDCILDLIDNSVDAAWGSIAASPTKLSSGTKLSKFRIRLDISADTFQISDNCGGISLDDAVDYAFTFGREGMASGDDFTIGVYGIGMKRAVFKLGESITVSSTHQGDESFAVPINVPDWMADAGTVWDFDIESAPQLREPGVQVKVDQLTTETATTFADPGFINRLRTTIARDYMLPLMQGLLIEVNGKAVEGWAISFRTSTSFQAMRERYSEGEVAIEVFAGMVSSPPATSEPSERNVDRRSGWYVLCNGRVVVAADRSALTVWGKDKFPGWHPQYEGFVGVVLFSSKHPQLLPMTTTKNSVDTASGVYKRALAKMIPPTRSWIDYTNARKVIREEARQKENAAVPLAIEKVKDRKSVKLPTSSGAKSEANVLYTVPVARIRQLARAFGKSTMAYREVGVRSFEYSYEQLVDDES